ncbi:MAG: alpha/beta fold hydrolase [Candidatus Falkowbacteria bacterium]
MPKIHINLTRLLIITLAAILVGYLVLVIYVYLNQRKMIYFPQPLDARSLDAAQATAINFQDISIAADDGTLLRGWLRTDSTSTPQNLLIYFGGNAEELSYELVEIPRLAGWSIALINYRGYGQSGGQPSQDKLFADALSIYDHFAKRTDINKDKIVIMGRSLGTTVATYLASRRPSCQVILISPISSMVDVAQSHYPYLPASFLMQEKFLAINYAATIKTPLFYIYADQDKVVYPALSQRLAAAWLGAQSGYLAADQNHNSIMQDPKVWPLIKQHIAQCP